MKKIGNQTFELEKGCFVIGKASIVGQKEKNGTYKNYFKSNVSDDRMGEKTFEKGERQMLLIANKSAIKDSKLKTSEIDLYLGGDLMNQIISSNYVAENVQVPFVGIYSACATITASVGLASLLIDSGAFANVLCSTISHFSSAERQYRFPLEYGGQRTPTAQWTVTGSGALIIGHHIR